MSSGDSALFASNFYYTSYSRDTAKLNYHNLTGSKNWSVRKIDIVSMYTSIRMYWLVWKSRLSLKLWSLNLLNTYNNFVWTNHPIHLQSKHGHGERLWRQVKVYHFKSKLKKNYMKKLTTSPPFDVTAF